MSDIQTLHDRAVKLSLRGRMVLRLLAEQSDQDGFVSISRAAISEKVGLVVGEGVEPTHAARLVRNCIAAELLRVSSRLPDRQNTNEYQLLYPAEMILAIPFIRHAVVLDGMSLGESLVYLTIRETKWPDSQQGWPTLRMLAARAGVSMGTLRANLRTLIANGFIAREYGEMPFPVKFVASEAMPDRVL